MSSHSPLNPVTAAAPAGIMLVVETLGEPPLCWRGLSVPGQIVPRMAQNIREGPVRRTLVL